MSTRRDFLKGMGLATAGLTLAPGELWADKKKKAQPAPAPKSEKVKQVRGYVVVQYTAEEIRQRRLCAAKI